MRRRFFPGSLSRLFGLLVGCIVSGTLTADHAVAQSGTVVLESSRIYVFVAKKGVGHEHGIEGQVAAGEIHLDRGQQVGSLKFNLQSFAADTTNARKFFNLPGETEAETQAEVNANMHGASVLNIAQFPTAEWVITKAQALPPEAGQQGTPYQLDGEFTLHGVKREVRITAVAEQVNGLVRLRGRFPLKQTDYGIKPFSKLLGAVGIGDELRIYGDLWLRP